MIELIIFIVSVIGSWEFESTHDDIIDDLDQTLKQSRGWHIADFRSLAFIVIPTLLFYSFGVPMVFDWWGVLRLIAAIGFIGLSRITFFNMRLNVKNGWPIFHLGENGWDGYFENYQTLYYIIAFILLAADITVLWLLGI